MDIKINNISFQGKSEILYGLTKAAKIARSSELAQKAYTTSRNGMTKFEELTAYDASMRAYFDMVTKDSEFPEIVKNLLNSEEIKPIKNILKEENIEHGTIQPLTLFFKKMIDVAAKNQRSTEVFNAIGTLSYILRR